MRRRHRFVRRHTYYRIHHSSVGHLGGFDMCRHSPLSHRHNWPDRLRHYTAGHRRRSDRRHRNGHCRSTCHDIPHHNLRTHHRRSWHRHHWSRPHRHRRAGYKHHNSQHRSAGLDRRPRSSLGHCRRSPYTLRPHRFAHRHRPIRRRHSGVGHCLNHDKPRYSPSDQRHRKFRIVRRCTPRHHRRYCHRHHNG